MGERWRVFFFGWFFVAFLFKYFLCDFLCDFCVNFCAILCEFLCDFCVNFCVIFVRIFVWVHKGNACGVRRHFAGATFWGDIYGIMELWNDGIMEYSITLLGLDWAREVGREVKYFVRGGVPRAKNRCSMGATLSKKLAIFLPIFFQTSEILQVLFYKIEILFLAYRRWGIKHLQVT